MKIKFLIILLVPFLTGFVASTIPDWSDDPKAAFQSTLLEARQIADSKDRPYMIMFQADWCSPCQWMDKFTLNDPRVQQSLLHNYSAVKMDIDEFEGFALKEQYQVKLLPTLIFFGRNNEVIGRYENTYDVDDFLRILETHKNFDLQKNQVNRSASSPVTVSASKTSSPLRRPVTQTSSTPTRRPVQSTVTSRPATNSTHQNTIISSGEFTIQIGAFNNYTNAESMLNKMSGKVSTGQALRVRQLDHIKYPYRVTIGQYYSHEEASIALLELDNKGIKGLLKRTNQFQ